MSVDNQRHCPFCGGTEFSSNEWYLDSADELVDALECKGCFAGAPIAAFDLYTERQKSTGDAS